MELNDWRSLVTLIAFGSFVVIAVWVYTRKQHTFNDAAQLPFLGEDAGQPKSGGTHE